MSKSIVIYAFRGLAKFPFRPAWCRGTRNLTTSSVCFNVTGPSTPFFGDEPPPSLAEPQATSNEPHATPTEPSSTVDECESAESPRRRLSASKSSIQAYFSASGSHEIQPTLDIPTESDPLLAYFTSHLMLNGKRHAAARRTSQMLLHLYAMTRSPPLPIFRHAVELAAPSIRVVSQKKGGKMVHKPIPLSEKQRTFFAIVWILEAAANNRGKTVEERVAHEVLNIIRDKSPVLKKKHDVHHLGMVNRANVKTRVAS